MASAIGILLLSLPSIIGIIKQRGLVRFLVLTLGIGAILIGLESIANYIRMPYGTFSYSSILGYKFFNTVPWSVALAYVFLICGSFWLASRITKRAKVFLGSVLMLGTHAVLHPALTRMQLISWDTSGVFYGMSPINFLGWFVVAFISLMFVAKIWGDKPVKRSTAYSAFIMILFWAGVNLGLNQWVPGGMGLAIGLMMIVAMRREKKQDLLEPPKKQHTVEN